MMTPERIKKIKSTKTSELQASDWPDMVREIERLQAIEKAVLKYLKADEDSVEAAYYELCALCGIEPKD